MKLDQLVGEEPHRPFFTIGQLRTSERYKPGFPVAIKLWTPMPLRFGIQRGFEAFFLTATLRIRLQYVGEVDAGTWPAVSRVKHVTESSAPDRRCHLLA